MKTSLTSTICIILAVFTLASFEGSSATNGIGSSLSIECFDGIKDSVVCVIPDDYYRVLMDLLSSRIKACDDSIAFLWNNQESVVATRAREKAENRIQESIKKYKERRERYAKWVTTLPASVQKDAKILAIPESSLSVGYVGGCDYDMTFVNMSKKTIKYLIWNGKVKNAVGDYISCEVRHTSSFSGKYTGPCYGLDDSMVSWDNVLYNSSAYDMVLTAIKIIYTDGSSVSIGSQSLNYLSNIPTDVLGGMRDFWGYSMSSPYDDGYDLEEEVSIIKNDVSQEIMKERWQLGDLSNKYKKFQRLFSEFRGSTSVLNTFMKCGNAYRDLNSDVELIKAAEDYYNSLVREESIVITDEEYY